MHIFKTERSGKFAPLHILITIGFIIGVIASYVFTDTNGLLRKIIWFLAAVGPYVAFLALSLMFGGLPKFLRTRTGGIILLVLCASLFALVPSISTILFIAYLAFGILAYFKSAGRITSAFAPKGRISIRSVDSAGNVSVKEVDVYEDMDDAVRSVKNQLESEGNKVKVTRD